MSFVRRLRRAYRALTREQFEEMGLLGPPAVAGVSVSQATANTVAAYWNGVCVIAGDIGVIDRHLYRRSGEAGDRERATNHPSYRLIHDQPNPETTAMQFWETITSHAVSWGNGYAEIEYDNASRPIGLWNIPPDQIEPKVETFVDRRGRATIRKFYLYKGSIRLEYDEILHIAGLGFDGIRGYSPVSLARQSLGLTMAAERFGAAFFGNGTWAGVALEHPGELGDEAQKNLQKSMEDMHRGPERAHKLLILEEGMKVSRPISIPPNDAQFLESRGFQIEEVARWLNLPPHKLKHKVNERPGGNFEASEIDYQVTTLLPWATRIEQECDRKLVSPAQRGAYYTEHNFSKRLKTDTATRAQAQKTYWEMGVLSADQIARQENLPKPENPLQPPRMIAPASRTAEVEPTVVDASARRIDAGRIQEAQRALLRGEIARFMRREADRARRAAAGGRQKFGAWVETFYGPGETGVLRTSIEPAVRICLAVAGSDGDAGEVAEGFARGYIEQSRAAMLDLGVRDLAAGVSALLKTWETSRANEALEELCRAFAPVEEEANVA